MSTLVSETIGAIGSLISSTKAPSRNFPSPTALVAQAVSAYGVPWDAYFQERAGQISYYYSLFDHEQLSKADMDARVQQELNAAVTYAKGVYEQQHPTASLGGNVGAGMLGGEGVPLWLVLLGGGVLLWTLKKSMRSLK